MSKLLNHPEVKPLLSDEHFSVDGTLIEAWASHKISAPRTAVATMTAGPTPTASSAKTTRMRALAIPTADLPQGRRAGSKALLHGPRHHGEPPWAGGGGLMVTLVVGRVIGLIFAHRDALGPVTGELLAGVHGHRDWLIARQMIPSSRRDRSKDFWRD